MLYTAASSFDIGWVLMEPDERSKNQVIAYANRVLNNAGLVTSRCSCHKFLSLVINSKITSLYFVGHWYASASLCRFSLCEFSCKCFCLFSLTTTISFLCYIRVILICVQRVRNILLLVCPQRTLFIIYLFFLLGVKSLYISVPFASLGFLRSCRWPAVGSKKFETALWNSCRNIEGTGVLVAGLSMVNLYIGGDFTWLFLTLLLFFSTGTPSCTIHLHKGMLTFGFYIFYNPFSTCYHYEVIADILIIVKRIIKWTWTGHVMRWIDNRWSNKMKIQGW